jgi:predicted anti-sigma-YlaC factor YlaD
VKTCEEVRALIPAFVALELAPEIERSVRRHLATCVPCRTAVEQVEPACGLALRLPAEEGDDAETFVAAVIGGLHQRRAERRLGGGRWRWFAAAAAVVVAFLAGTQVRRGGEPAATVALSPTAAPAVRPAEGSFVEVEGTGVRLYQITDPTNPQVAVAVVVDPALEL